MHPNPRSHNHSIGCRILDCVAHRPNGFRRLRAVRLFVAMAMSGLLISPALAGAVSGQVSNEATGAYLEGARIELQGTGTSTFTDRQGRYTLTVPPGEATLLVSYTGLDTQIVPLTIPSGSLTRNVALTSAAYKMEAFVVE